MKWNSMTVIKTHQRKSFFFCFYGCLTRECGHLPLHLLYNKFLALYTLSMQLIGHALGFRKCSQSWRRHAERGATALYLWLGIQVGCFMWVSEPIQTLQEKNLRADCNSSCSKIFIKYLEDIVTEVLWAWDQMISKTACEWEEWEDARGALV